MVYRIYVEKRSGLTVEADALKNDISSFLGIKSVTGVRFLNRYDAENITPELFEYAKTTVFSEPQVDLTYDSLKVGEGDTVFAVEYLPGQYDQRADSASQCIQIISQGNRPLIRTAKIYVLSGNVSEDELERIKKYVIQKKLLNPYTMFPRMWQCLTALTSLTRTDWLRSSKNTVLRWTETTSVSHATISEKKDALRQ